MDGLDCQIPPCCGSQIDPDPPRGNHPANDGLRTLQATSLCHCSAKMGGVFGPAFRHPSPWPMRGRGSPPSQREHAMQIFRCGLSCFSAPPAAPWCCSRRLGAAVFLGFSGPRGHTTHLTQTTAGDTSTTHTHTPHSPRKPAPASAFRLAGGFFATILTISGLEGFAHGSPSPTSTPEPLLLAAGTVGRGASRLGHSRIGGEAFGQQQLPSGHGRRQLPAAQCTPCETADSPLNDYTD